MIKISNNRDKLKGTPPPSFCRFSNLEDGATESIEFFTTNRTSKMMGHVFEEKFFPGVFGFFWRFLENLGFFILPRKTPIRFCPIRLKIVVQLPMVTRQR
jgi:hypothetical protein